MPDTSTDCRAGSAARVYPDFIFAILPKTNLSRVILLETKGDQLDNLDTAYKRELLKVMSDAFQWDATVPAGTLNLVKDSGETVECALILMSEWKAKLPGYLTEASETSAKHQLGPVGWMRRWFPVSLFPLSS